MKSLASFLILTLFALLFGCEQDNVNPSAIAVGQSFRVGTATLLFAGVADDGRCPCEVRCMWEGVATVVLTSGSDTVRLHTLDRTDLFYTTAIYRNRTLRLVELAPAPCGGAPRSQEDYRLTLAIE